LAKFSNNTFCREQRFDRAGRSVSTRPAVLLRTVGAVLAVTWTVVELRTVRTIAQRRALCARHNRRLRRAVATATAAAATARSAGRTGDLVLVGQQQCIALGVAHLTGGRELWVGQARGCLVDLDLHLRSDLRNNVSRLFRRNCGAATATAPARPATARRWLRFGAIFGNRDRRILRRYCDGRFGGLSHVGLELGSVGRSGTTAARGSATAAYGLCVFRRCFGGAIGIGWWD